MLWIWGFLALVAHAVGRKCGSPPRYPDKELLKKYEVQQEFNHEDRVMYKCALGFSGTGTRVSSCVNGAWTNVDLQCTEKKCGSAGEIPNGRFRQTGNKFRDTAHAECDSGYVLQGESFIRHCLAHGWNGTIPRCVVTPVQVTCPPPDVRNRSGKERYKAEYEVGERATVSCQEGYDLIGSSQITCAEDGNWQDLPKCQVAEVADVAAVCPLLRNEKATFHGTKLVYNPGEILPYTCNAGFQPGGNNSVLQCNHRGRWSPHRPNCLMIKCKPLSILNGKVNTGQHRLNTQASIRCHDGFYLRGHKDVTCGGQGIWIPSVPTCEKVTAVTCPPPDVPNSSGKERYKAEYEVGERATVSCQEGYDLIGLSQVTCAEDGNWQDLPKCQVAEGKCQRPPYVTNGHTEHNDQMLYEPNTALHFKCNYGYRAVRGSSTIYCRNGRWTELEMICEKKKCGSAGEVRNGRYHYTGISFGDAVTARCHTGHQLVGKAMRFCRANGWDGRAPVCEAIQCPEPPVVPGADLLFDTSGIIKYGYVASYRCPYGTLIGESDLVCTEHGTWSAPAPRCEVTCPPIKLWFGVIVSGMRPRYPPGSRVNFKCNPGRRISGPNVITCGVDGYWKPSLPHCVI